MTALVNLLKADLGLSCILCAVPGIVSSFSVIQCAGLSQIAISLWL